VIPLLTAQISADLKADPASLAERIARYDNQAILARAIGAIRTGA